MKYRLFLLEDDTALSEILCEYLEEQGYDITHAPDAEIAEEKLYENRFDLLLLDVKVPHMSGFDLLSKLRAQGVESPAIFLTSLSAIEDLSRAFEVGCDDYLRKPFELKELLLRIQSLIKRNFFHKSDEKIRIGEGVFFDLKTSKVHTQQGAISLPKKETAILKLLLKRQGQIVTLQEFFENAWDYEEEPSELSLRTFIKDLRKVLGKERIENVRSQGYRLVAD